jgi:hypothetical protein
LSTWGAQLTWIAKGDGRGDLAGDGGGELLGRVVDELRALGVSGEDDLGVGTLGEGLLSKTRPRTTVSTLPSSLSHTCLHLSGPGRITTREEARNVGGILHALDGQLVVANLAGEGLEEGRARGGAHVADLGGAAGEDDGDGLAGPAEAVLGGAAEAGLTLDGAGRCEGEEGDEEGGLEGNHFCG